MYFARAKQTNYKKFNAGLLTCSQMDFFSHFDDNLVEQISYYEEYSLCSQYLLVPLVWDYLSWFGSGLLKSGTIYKGLHNKSIKLFTDSHYYNAI